MKCFVTGASGFIGANLVHELVARGHEVKVLLRPGADERGLAGTLGTFYVFYDLSRRFTLRGESGIQNAVDLIFTTRYD